MPIPTPRLVHRPVGGSGIAAAGIVHTASLTGKYPESSRSKRAICRAAAVRGGRCRQPWARDPCRALPLKGGTRTTWLAIDKRSRRRTAAANISGTAARAGCALNGEVVATGRLRLSGDRRSRRREHRRLPFVACSEPVLRIRGTPILRSTRPTGDGGRTKAPPRPGPGSGIDDRAVSGGGTLRRVEVGKTTRFQWERARRLQIAMRVRLDQGQCGRRGDGRRAAARTRWRDTRVIRSRRSATPRAP